MLTFLLLYAYLYHIKPLAACMLLRPCINSARQRASQPEVMHSQLSYCHCSALVSDAEVKNMGNYENSNEKLMFFDVANSRLQSKGLVFNRNRLEKN